MSSGGKALTMKRWLCSCSAKVPRRSPNHGMHYSHGDGIYAGGYYAYLFYGFGLRPRSWMEPGQRALQPALRQDRHRAGASLRI